MGQLRAWYDKNLDSTLLFIRPGKIWPIKVESDWVSTGRTFIAIPTWDARHFHIRFLGDHLGHASLLCVRPSHWNPFTTKNPPVLLESVHFKGSVCLSAFLSKIRFPLLVLWLLGHLDGLFWQRSRLWVTLLIGSVYFGIYPYQLPLHSVGPLPGIPDKHMEWRSHLVLGSCVLIDRLVESHKCWGDTWHNFSGWLLGPKRLFIFCAVSSIYMLLLPSISTFHNHFPVLESHHHLQESVTLSPQCILSPRRFRPFSAPYTYKCSPSYTHIFSFLFFFKYCMSVAYVDL